MNYYMNSIYGEEANKYNKLEDFESSIKNNIIASLFFIVCGIVLTIFYIIFALKYKHNHSDKIIILLFILELFLVMSTSVNAYSFSEIKDIVDKNNKFYIINLVFMIISPILMFLVGFIEYKTLD